MKQGRPRKAKGNAFENLMGRKFSLWLTEGEDDTQLIKSRGSGSWRDARWRHAGDLAPNGPAGEEFRQLVMVECKHRNTALLYALFSEPGDKNIQGWWAKLSSEARELELTPMLVFRQNNRPVMIAVEAALAYMLAYSEKTVIEAHGLGIIPLELLFEWRATEFYELLDDFNRVESI